VKGPGAPVTNVSPGDLADLKGTPFFFSWSGGKDSCLALQRAVAAGGDLRCLVSMLDGGGERTGAHGLPVAFLEAQAEAIGVPLVLGSAGWNDYERVFTGTVRKLASEGVTAAVFGDIDLEAHLEWEQRVLGAVGLRIYQPLWMDDRRALVDEAIASPIEAIIVAARAGELGKEFVGRRLTPDCVRDLEAAGADAAGEDGEYHTAVVDGPLFAHRIDVEIEGVRNVNDHWQAQLAVKERSKEAE